MLAPGVRCGGHLSVSIISVEHASKEVERQAMLNIRALYLAMAEPSVYT